MGIRECHVNSVQYVKFISSNACADPFEKQTAYYDYYAYKVAIGSVLAAIIYLTDIGICT